MYVYFNLLYFASLGLQFTRKFTHIGNNIFIRHPIFLTIKFCTQTLIIIRFDDINKNFKKNICCFSKLYSMKI